MLMFNVAFAEDVQYKLNHASKRSLLGAAKKTNATVDGRRVRSITDRGSRTGDAECGMQDDHTKAQLRNHYSEKIAKMIERH